MLKSHMQYHWWKYLLVILTSVMVWCMVFNALAQPADNEKLKVLFVGEKLDTAGLEQAITALLPEVTEQAVRQVEVTQTVIEGQAAYQVLEMRTYEYDIVIISQSYLQENMGLSLFSGAMTAQMQQYFSGVPLYTELREQEQVPSGFLLEAGAGAFGTYYAGQEQCYLFPSPQSVNFDRLNGQGQAGDDCALRIMAYLMGCEEQEAVQP